MPAHPGVKKIGRLMLPAIFGSAIYQFNQFMGTLLASFLAHGSVSWLYYGDRLVQFPLGVFAIAISTAALPSLSRTAAERELNEFRETLGHALRLVFFITIPSLVGLITLGKLIIQVFFQGGAFDAFHTAMTAQALIFYALGLWAFSGIRVMLSAFYALQDTRTPVKLGLVAVMANLAFSLTLMGPLKHGGLALALSLASTLQFALLLFFFKKKMAFWSLRPIFESALKCVLASIAMGLGIYYIYSRWWVPDPALGVLHLSTHLAGLVLIGALIYFVATWVLGCRELSSLLDVLNPIRKRSVTEE
jgi:putative peptidoglycan lipid II flippase